METLTDEATRFTWVLIEGEVVRESEPEDDKLTDHTTTRLVH